MEKIVYIDLDGTCFEFKRHATLDPLFEKGYFKKLTPFHNVINGIKMFKNKHSDITIKSLSAYVDAPNVIEDKNALMDKHMPFITSENRIYIKYGEDKGTQIEEGKESFMLDDYTPNLKSAQKRGCKGIKLINDINWNTKSWKGDKIHYDMPDWMIADTLEKIIYKEKNNELV